MNNKKPAIIDTGKEISKKSYNGIANLRPNPQNNQTNQGNQNNSSGSQQPSDSSSKSEK